MIKKGYRLTTKEEFQRFKTEALRVIDKLGLSEWKIYFEWKDLSEDATNANISWKAKNMVANIVFSRLLPCDMAACYSPEASARHEIVHLLTAKLETMADHGKSTQEEIYQESEAIANRLEKLL